MGRYMKTPTAAHVGAEERPEGPAAPGSRDEARSCSGQQGCGSELLRAARIWFRTALGSRDGQQGHGSEPLWSLMSGNQHCLLLQPSAASPLLRGSIDPTLRLRN